MGSARPRIITINNEHANVKHSFTLTQHYRRTTRHNDVCTCYLNTMKRLCSVNALGHVIKHNSNINQCKRSEWPHSIGKVEQTLLIVVDKGDITSC